MANKPITQEEFSRKGAEATNTKYPKEVRSGWGKTGPEKLKEKYGDDYFTNLAAKGREAINKKKQKINPIKKFLGLK